MKTVVYITKKKIWVGEQTFDWNGVSLDEVFGKIKKELRIDDIRIVLGNDVSFVTAVKAGDTFLTRENVLKLVKSWMPFEIDNNCFDWKQINLAHDEVWIQVVALEKELLMSLSSAVKKHGIKVELVTAIGVLLGKTTAGREAPVIIKWINNENLLVLAVNGLVDLVVSEINDDDLMLYAKQKWGLAVNPEEIVINENDFNLTKNVFSEKSKGDDKLILNLPMLKDIVEVVKPEENIFKGEMIEEDDVKKPASKLWIYLVILLIVLVVGIVVMYKAGFYKSIFPGTGKIETVTPTPMPTVEVTPEPTKVDLSIYQVQVLNGSGVTGEAANIKTSLLGNGFVNIDTGNATATTEGVIRIKSGVPDGAVKFAVDVTEDYKMGELGTLTADDKYDLIIVIGSAKKL